MYQSTPFPKPESQLFVDCDSGKGMEIYKCLKSVSTQGHRFKYNFQGLRGSKTNKTPAYSDPRPLSYF